MRYTPVKLEPRAGGDLITRLSPENVGGNNYVVKRDWRRFFDAEIRREGHVKFAPNEDEPAADQYLVEEDDPITLVHFSRKPNGQTAVIVGTQHALYRYFSFEDGGVYTVDVYTSDVYENLDGQWLVIGANFSEDGNRWEAKDIAGKTVFNNGVDLPVVYDLGWLEVRPLYELREQGFAFVGTIEEFNGMLALGDVAELVDVDDIMTGRIFSNASQTGVTVTATSSAFTSDDVGSYIIFESTGEYGKILSVDAVNIATVDNYQAAALGPIRIAKLYGTVTDSEDYSRVQYRIISSDIGDPTNFGGGFNGVTGTAGDYSILFPWAVFSLSIGDEIEIAGAGADDADLTTTITSIDGSRKIFGIADALVTTITDAFVQRSDRVSSVASSFDLQDDGSPIVRMIELQGRLVVLKETGIFVGQFTGSTTTGLIQFQKVYSGHDSISWKWTLVKVRGNYLLYAADTAFFTFDLSSLQPRIHEKLTLCDSVFYDGVDERDDDNQCWAADNAITNEIWFGFPAAGTDQILCYDYQTNTCSTIASAYSAMGSVKKPVTGSLIGVGEDWAIMGTTAGTVFQYGLTNLATGVWTRDGSNYDSTIKSGYLATPEEFDELNLRNYVVYFSQYTTPVTVSLYGARNANETASTLFTRDIAAPANKNLIPTYFRKNYFQDQILVTGQTSNASVVKRVYEFDSVDSRSTVRNNST